MTVIVVILLMGWAGLGAPLAIASQLQPDSAAAVQIRHLGQAPANVEPGSTMTAPLRLRNRSDSLLTVQMGVDAPSEWTLLTPPTPVTLAPTESKIRLLSLSVPPQAPKRSERIRVRILCAKDSSVLQTTRVEAQVQAKRELRLSLLDAPETVRAGNRYRASFAVRNLGNVSTRVRLQAQSARSFSTKVDSSAVRLGPAEVKQVRATVQTSRMRRARKDYLTLRARARSSSSAEQEGSGPMARARASVEVVPISSENLYDPPDYPLTLGVQTLGTRRSQAGQARIQGDGYLTADRKRHVELFLRGPGQRGISTFGRRSHYSATYTSEEWTVRGGDQIYETTPLAAPGRFGFGGEVRHRMGNWRLGAYAQTSRRGIGSQVASYATYKDRSGASLTATLLRSEGIYEGTLAAVEGQLSPWSNASLAIESGVGVGPEGLGAGLRAELSGQHTWGNYHVRHFRADAGFPSPWGGERLSTVQARFRLTDRAFLFGRAKHRRLASSLDSSPRTYRSLQVGGAVRGTLGDSRWSLRVRGTSDKKLLRRKRTARMESRLRTGRLGLTTILEAGQAAFGGASFEPFRSYEGRLLLRTSWLQFSGFAKSARIPTPIGGNAESRVSLGAASQIQIGEGTDLSFEVEWRGLSNETFRTRRFASVDFRHELPSGHSLTAQFRLDGFADFRRASTPEFEVGYNVPIGLPLAGDTRDRSVTGRVVNAKNGTGLADAIVHVGDTKQFTDESGHFSVPLPRKSTTYLRVSPPATDGVHRVPMLDTPLRIAPSDSVSTLIIPMRQSASLSVQVTEYAYQDLQSKLRSGKLKSIGGLTDVVLEATDGTGQTRRLTNRQGRAIFKGLRPGTWTIRVVNPQLPENRVLKQKAYEVTLEPGTQESVKMRVVPKQRRIKVREDRSLKLDSGSN